MKKNDLRLATFKRNPTHNSQFRTTAVHVNENQTAILIFRFAATKPSKQMGERPDPNPSINATNDSIFNWIPVLFSSHREDRGKSRHADAQPETAWRSDRGYPRRYAVTQGALTNERVENAQSCVKCYRRMGAHSGNGAVTGRLMLGMFTLEI